MEARGAEGGLNNLEMTDAEPSCSRHDAASVKPVCESLEKAIQYKTLGNTFYKERNIREAISSYHRALLVLRSIDSEVWESVKRFTPETHLTREQETLLRNTQVDCYNNLAACLLLKKSVNYARVLEYSLRVLQRQPGNIKALYRAGVATLETGDASTAKMYLTQACKKQPNDVNIMKHLQRAEEKLHQELQKEKALYQGMFSSSLKNGTEDGVNQSNTAGNKV